MKKKKQGFGDALNNVWLFAKERKTDVLCLFALAVLTAFFFQAFGVFMGILNIAVDKIGVTEIQVAILDLVLIGCCLWLFIFYLGAFVEMAATLFCEKFGYMPVCYEITEQKGNKLYLRKVQQKEKWAVFGKRKLFWWWRK